ncbi:SDR family NAD(P)-dependent oxidoreductase [Janthinobacterium agaricidamnosum]|uniref:Short chain dehydrogenase family protein n=1 Tax=Janthinobacterium agaricidamnosum NBRC 102515 = DSM 9628 TaxID=1349767 RepID=W0V8F4_9BURK|nr:SDR family NAD(P)-dependent oxidoreductase [Janthinobacterium agaricidamnosum]CDG85099.1 short chain dehydrogenase family protein [Janthinobacterium agaricidamnosum NBRC 102515 = DSM 9628]
MNPRIDGWAGKYVWLIGASSGIGAATAVLLLEQGAHVALSARNQAALRQACVDQPLALALPLDITDHGSVETARDSLLASWPRIDLVLVVAGGYNEMRADSFDLAATNRMIDLNLRGVFNCLDLVLPVLLAQCSGGLGIVASAVGYGGLPKALVYGPTKAALINLTESLYFDLHPRGIAVYQINPGFVATPLTAGNDFKMPALMTAEAAAQQLLHGIERGAFHIHFPRRFTNSLRLARLLPYRLYFWLVRKVTGL